ncbi:flagellar hook-associated protein FlgK [Sporomusa sphaeroides]|uniref:flagellar hook-associated protein FlgK n=1 Tax=Sporomusa sphaeroides TaxID=47679 RepID=UPI003D9FD579
MGSTFGGYSIAYSGMYANQSALTVTSQNLSNVNTSGYSRQQINSAEKIVPISSQTSIGAGVAVVEVCRARNQLLDSTYHDKNASASYWSTKSGMLTYAQEILDEFSATDGSGSDGLQQTIQNFFDSWEELAGDAGNIANRQAVVEYAATLLDTLSSIDEQLAALQQDACNSAADIVDDINSIATQVAALNLQIVRAEAADAEASDLRDQRDYLLDQLSDYVNFSTQEQANGSVTVFIGGVALVSLNKSYELSLAGDGSTADPLVVRWADTGTRASITNGTLKACLEDADQTGIGAIDPELILDMDQDGKVYTYTASATSSLSNLRQGLNTLITTLAVKLNSLHSAGTGLDGSTGTDFFVAIDSSQPLSSTNIQVNPAIVSDLNKLAAGASGAAGDNTVAAAICDLSSANIYTFGGLSQDSTGFYQSLISWLSTAGSDAADYYDTQSALATQVDNQRQSISTVSLDEEMSNMITFQNAYAASARVLSVMDGLLADLIAELG